MKWICHNGVLALIWAALSTASSAAIAADANLSANANANINVKERKSTNKNCLKNIFRDCSPHQFKVQEQLYFISCLTYLGP